MTDQHWAYVVAAVQYKDGNNTEIADFVAGSPRFNSNEYGRAWVEIDTPQGIITVNDGEWLVRDPAGTLSAIDAETFANFEPIHPVERNEADDRHGPREPVEAHAEIEHLFTFHPPARPDTSAAHDAVRYECRMLAHWLIDHTPHSEERREALRALRTVMFWANAAIACAGPLTTPTPDPAGGDDA